MSASVGNVDQGSSSTVPLNVPVTDRKTVVPPDVPTAVPTTVPVNVPATVPKKVPATVPKKVPRKHAAASSNSVANSAAKGKRGVKRIKLGKRTAVSIRTYRKDPRVNIRDYVCDIHGDRHALKRGILLTSEQWNVLKDNIDVIDEGLKRRRVQ